LYGTRTTGPDRPGTPKGGISMAHILYRGHTIISSAFYDDVSGQWKLNACISWQGNDTDRIQFLKNSPEVFFRFEDTEGAGVEYSKDWVDNKVNKVL
jgi:hypothetical protein